MVACALVTGLFLVSWRTGVAASIWTGLAMSVPEVYLGLHYPSDLLGGAVLGVAVIVAFNLRPVRRVVAERVVPFADDQPALFYPVWFVMTLQAATLFSDGGPVVHWLMAVFHR
jgi:undecaprenyl-diphosphatase